MWYVYTMTSTYVHGTSESCRLVSHRARQANRRKQPREGFPTGLSVWPPHTGTTGHFITAERTETRRPCSASQHDGRRPGRVQVQVHVGRAETEEAYAASRERGMHANMSSYDLTFIKARAHMAGCERHRFATPSLLRPAPQRSSIRDASSDRLQLPRQWLVPAASEDSPLPPPRGQTPEGIPCCDTRPMTSLLCQRVERPLARAPHRRRL